MINSVRNTVLAIANKENYGYISPQDFNLYAKQAQMDMFENYFYQYNNWIIRENQRTSGIGYANIVKGLEEVIDSFSESSFLMQEGTYAPGGSFGLNIISNRFYLPNDYYLINKIFYYPSLLFSGAISGPAVGDVNDATAPFSTIPISSPTPSLNSIVVNNNNLRQARVVEVLSDTSLNTDQNLAFAAGDTYYIYANTNIVQVERVSQNKIFNLTSSNLTAPTKQFPAYTLDGTTNSQEFITVYPGSIQRQGDIHCQYIRYPKDPKWTYVSIGAVGAPVFDSSQPDYQDFELPLSDEPMLVSKICQYVGIEIREADVINFAMDQEQMDNEETS